MAANIPAGEWFITGNVKPVPVAYGTLYSSLYPVLAPLFMSTRYRRPQYLYFRESLTPSFVEYR